MNFSVLLVDDELPARDELKYLLSKDKRFNIIGEAESGKKALAMAVKLRPDIIFLDIQMYDMNGLEVADKIYAAGIKPYIVFVTAFDRYAVKAFELNALDYLLKPIRAERFQETLNRIVEISKENTDTLEEKIKNILFSYEEKNKLPRIPVEDNERIILLKPCEILYAEARDRGVMIFTPKKYYQTAYSLAELEEKLTKHNFIKTHRSFLVNAEYIKQVIPWFNNTYVVKLEGSNQDIPVSRTYAKEIKKIFEI